MDEDKNKGGADIEDDDVELDIEDDTDLDEDKGDQGKDKSKDRKDDDEDPEAKRARLSRMLDRHDKKHGLGKYAEKGGEGAKDRSKDGKSGELDLTQKAYLNSEGIKGKSEHGLVQEWMQDTGKSIEDIVENARFQAELKDLREGNATKEAMPKGTRRSTQTARDSVEYWVAKGELPPNTPENRELRQKVVNARIKAKKDTNQFTSTPVIGG